MSHDEYLRSFFVEPGRLHPGNKHGVSYAIACRDGALCALVRMGDARAKVLVEEVDPDPIRMAARVVELWKTLSLRKLDSGVKAKRELRSHGNFAH